MNASIRHLSELSSQKVKSFIGLMSGTSLDGLDIAHCRVKGAGEETEPELLHFKTSPYPDPVVKKLKAIVSVESVLLHDLCLAHTWMSGYHAGIVLEALKEWSLEPADIDCIASHGQTVYHAPGAGHGLHATLQIGDGDHIARKTGILTLSDFRQKHTAAGGEGAPMVSPVDRLLYTHPREDRILLNIGGIANFAFLPGKNNSAGRHLTGDTGPGNTLLNAVMREHFGRAYDPGGEIAASGKVHKRLLEQFKKHSYFRRSFPKTTGLEQFNMEWVARCRERAGIGEVPPEDLMATLARLTAETIAEAVRSVAGEGKPVLYASGGGVHNTTLMRWLEELLAEYPVERFESLSGYPADAKEAVAFAVLANEALSGEGFLLEETGERVNFGKLSFPG